MNRDLGVWTYEDCALLLIDVGLSIPVIGAGSHSTEERAHRTPCSGSPSSSGWASPAPGRSSGTR
jgi:hypothetical protein